MCKNKVNVYVSNDATPDSIEITVNCGDIYNNGHSTKAALCPTCEKVANDNYPQGWQYTPGDICKHGVYVGGDRDCTCYQCEEE